MTTPMRAALFVRVHRVVAARHREAQRRAEQREIERHLGPGRTDFHAATRTAAGGTGRSAVPASRRRGRTGTSPGRRCGPASSVRGCDGIRKTGCPGARKTAPAQSSGCACASARPRGRIHDAYMLHYAARNAVRYRRYFPDSPAHAMNEQPSSAPQPRVGRQALLWAVKILVSGGLLVRPADARRSRASLGAVADGFAAVARRRARCSTSPMHRRQRVALGLSCSTRSTSPIGIRHAD